MKSYALLTMKLNLPGRPTKSDFIHHGWVYSVRMAALIEKTTSAEVVFSGASAHNGSIILYYFSIVALCTIL